MRLVSANPQTRRFFIFISIAIFGIFLQESVIEVFGAEVFGMSITETTRFQPIWGAGILLGMVLMGTISFFANVPKRVSTMIGCGTASVGFVGLGLIALFEMQELLIPALFIIGFCAGIFNVGALALMMDMTVEGATGMYMGLWGVAQAAGMGLSSVVAGALHTGLIGSALVAPEIGYWFIFTLEAGFLLLAAYALYGVKLDLFHKLANSVGTARPQEDPMAATLGATSA